MIKIKNKKKLGSLKLLIMVQLVLLLISNCTFSIKTKEELLKKQPESNLFLDKDKFRVTYECDDWRTKPVDFEQYYVWSDYPCADQSKTIDIIGNIPSGYFIGHSPMFGFIFSPTESVIKRHEADNIITNSCGNNLSQDRGEFLSSMVNPYASDGRCFKVIMYFETFQMLSANDGLFYQMYDKERLVHLVFETPFTGTSLFSRVIKSENQYTYSSRMGQNTVPSYKVLYYK